MTRTREVYDRATGQIVPAAEYYARKYADVAASHLAAPLLIRDVEPYRSMLTGEMVQGRRQHRDHLKAHGCVEVGNEKIRPPRETPMPSVAADIQRAMEQGPSPAMQEALYRARNAVPGDVA